MKKTIFLAGGCFWGTQKYMDQIKGVCETEVGFANGNTVNPSYEEVCHNNTGHAETVRVIYDDAVFCASISVRSTRPASTVRERTRAASTALVSIIPIRRRKRLFAKS